MNVLVHRIQRLVELGLLSRENSVPLIDELEAVQFGARNPGSVLHTRALYLCGRIPPETYGSAVRLSELGRGLLVSGLLFGLALFLCLRDPGSLPYRDLPLPTMVALGVGGLVTALLHWSHRPSLRRDEEMRRALECDPN